MSNVLVIEAEAATDEDIAANEQAIDTAMAWIAIHRPYYTAVMWSLRRFWTYSVPTLAVDQHLRLAMNPLFVKEMLAEPKGPSLVASALIHECHHVIRAHCDRLGPRDRWRWNVATDIEINQDLISDGLKVPGEWLSHEQENLPPNLVAEKYYDLLEQKKQEQQQSGEGQQGEQGDQGQGGQSGESGGGSSDGPPKGVGHGNCGSAVHTNGSDEMEAAAEAAGVKAASMAEVEVVKSRTAAAIKDAASRGNVPAGLERWAENLNKPKIPWRQVFAREVIRAGRIVQGSGKYTYQRPSRRNVPVVGQPVFPKRVGVAPRVGIVMDTSGSMDNKALSQGLSEIEGILRAARCADTQVWCCDADVADAQRVHSANQVNLIGGGGTDMRVGIKSATESGAEIVVVLTDGWTPWPNESPGIPVIAAIIGQHVCDDAPAWIKRVRIEVDT